MKKNYVIIALLLIVSACSNNTTEKKDEKAPDATAKVEDLSKNPDYQKGLELVAKSDCLTCHKVSEKLTGPAYRDVAVKYENTEANIKLLASKIIKGGSGVYGAIPMTPHPTISEADAQQMVKYILLLRNK